MPKDFDPQDPMELVGVEMLGGGQDQALDAIVQEYLFLGWQPRQILFFFRSPYYQVTHQIYLQKGEPCVKDRIQRLAEEWQRGWLAGGAHLG